MMTLGPAAILCSFGDRMTGAIKNVLVMFGRVPFAFYVAHIFLIHLLSVLLGVILGFSVHQMMTNFLFYPKGYGVGLFGVYAVGPVVVPLYPFCRCRELVHVGGMVAATFEGGILRGLKPTSIARR
jgi:hypothetical protein